MTESSLTWPALRDGVGRFGKLTRVENSLELGTPDVHYCLRWHHAARSESGWVELKWLERWPVRDRTPVVLEKLTLDQKNFAVDYAEAGGRYRLLLQAGKDFALLDHTAVVDVYERKVTTSELRVRALVFGEGHFPARDVLWSLAKL